MAITHNYVDYGAGNDTTGDGTVGTPWKTLQKAFDTLTRNTTDGNQVNLKAGTAHVNAAALDLTTLIAGGALSGVAPLIIRGYTSAANDGGIGEIDCGGATMFAATTYDYIIMADLEIHTFGDNNGLVLDQYATLYHCEIHKGVSSPSGKSLVTLGLYSKALACYLHDIGAAASRGLRLNNNGLVMSCYVDMGADSTSYGIDLFGTFSYAIGNVVKCSNVNQYALFLSAADTAIGNIAYSSTSSTKYGIFLDSATSLWSVALNNIVVGWSGAGGSSIKFSGDAQLVGHNAFYNNTANYTVVGQTFIDLTANDVALAADPFTDAANGDFSLTAAAKTALAAKGFPLAYLGAHANTVPNLNIGPIQLAAGRPAFGDRSGGKF